MSRPGTVRQWAKPCGRLRSEALAGSLRGCRAAHALCREEMALCGKWVVLTVTSDLRAKLADSLACSVSGSDAPASAGVPACSTSSCSWLRETAACPLALQLPEVTSQLSPVPGFLTLGVRFKMLYWNCRVLRGEQSTCGNCHISVVPVSLSASTVGTALAWEPGLLTAVKFRSVIGEARRLLVLDWNLKETCHTSYQYVSLSDTDLIWGIIAT